MPVASLLILIGMTAADVAEYRRVLDASAFDQAAFDAETFGEKEALKRTPEGLAITLPPGKQETGWKTPQQVRFGGDFTIEADFTLTTLPKPALPDGSAIGLAFASQDVNQPDVTLLRLTEPGGEEAYRIVLKSEANTQADPNMPQRGMMMGMPGGGPPKKPDRRLFPAKGTQVHVEARREGSILRFEVHDEETPEPRYIGQAEIGTNDVAGVKLFAANRNGAEPIDVVLERLVVRADRISGLGTVVKTVRGAVYYGDPTAIEDELLIVGGPPPTPPAAETPAETTEEGGETPKPSPAAEDTPAPAPAEAAAPAQPVVAQVVIAQPAAGGPGGAVAMIRVAPGQVAVASGPSPPQGGTPSGPTPPGDGQPGDEPAKPAEPKAKLPLDQVESIAFERTPVLSGRFLGQPTIDLTRPGLPDPNAQPEPASVAKPDDKGEGEGKSKPADDGDADATAPPPADPKPVGDPEPKPDGASGPDVPADGPKSEEKPADEAEPSDAESKPVVDGPADDPNPDPAVEPAPAAESKPEAEAGTTAEKPGGVETASEAKPASVDTAPTEGPKADDPPPAETPAEDPSKPSVAELMKPPPGTIAAEKIPKYEPAPNGKRDIQIALAGLAPAEITQVTVTCQTDKGATSYRLDTSDSRDWPLVVRRVGTEPFATLFLEPPPGDAFEKDFAVAVTYADGQSGNASIKADGHTDPDLAFDAEMAQPLPPDARVYLTGGAILFGKLTGIDSRNFHIKTIWGDELDVPLERLAAFHLVTTDAKEAAEAFSKRVEDRGAEDLLLARTKEGEVVAIAGVLEGTEGDRLQFRYRDQTRTIPLQGVEGVLLASRPESPGPDDLLPSFKMASGLVVDGRWTAIEATAWKVEAPWGQELKLPPTDVLGVRFRGGEMVYLSDLEPSRVVERPYFGALLPWRKDVNLRGKPLKIEEKTYAHGLAVHSLCDLTYDLGGGFATFEAVVGFDDEALGRGRVDCRVFADDREIYAAPDLRADEHPVALSLPVEGARSLRLVVDYGPTQNVGDRVIWADARLYRTAKPVAPASDTPDPERTEE